MTRLKKITQGFTLIELMIVVAIIGVLVAIAVPNFLRFQCKAKQAEAKGGLKAIYSTQLAYNGEFGSYLNLADLTNYGGLDPKTVQGKYYAYTVVGTSGFTATASDANPINASAPPGSDVWKVTEAAPQVSGVSNACN